MFEGLTEEYIAKTKPVLEIWHKYIKGLNSKDTELNPQFHKIYNEIYKFANGDSSFEEADNACEIDTYLNTMDIDDIEYSPYIMLSRLREYKYYVIDNNKKLNK